MFIRQFLKRPMMTGAIAPSSAGLARRMLEKIDFDAAKMVVEFGPGTGVFTQLVASMLRTHTQFFALELNPEMHEAMCRKFPGIDVHHASAAEVRKYLALYQAESADAIISGLPWAIFSEALQDEIITATVGALKPGGHFATFAYIQGLVMPAGISFKRRLVRHFSTVEISPIVWRNTPPAFVYWCTK